MKSKELNRMILNRDNSLDPYLSKQFVFENILSNKDSFVENNNQSESISKTPTQINVKFDYIRKQNNNKDFNYQFNKIDKHD